MTSTNGRDTTMASIADDPNGRRRVLFVAPDGSRKTEPLEEFPVHVVAARVGHAAKVSLRHYAQTTEDHFDRATRGAGTGAPGAQQPAQQTAAGTGRERKPRAEGETGDEVGAIPCESSPHAATSHSGGEGIRTLGRGKPVSGFQDTSCRREFAWKSRHF